MYGNIQRRENMGEPDLITFGIVCVATLKNISEDYLTYIYLKLN